jgi:hypothetical protein
MPDRMADDGIHPITVMAIRAGSATICAVYR